WIVSRSAAINHWYFYCVDADFGPFFLKYVSYFPYNAKLCINGNEWAKQQATKAGIRFTPLDNGFAACGDVPALQALCDSFGPEHIEALLHKWQAILPCPFTGRGSGRGLRLRHLDLAGGVLPDPDAGPAGVRAGVLRTGHPRQPRHRPPGPRRVDLRPAGPPRHSPARPGPRHYPPGHPPRAPAPKHQKKHTRTQ